MLGTRYEEYSHFFDNLPFRLAPNIEITASAYSHEANWHDNLELELCTDGQGSVMLDEKIIAFTKNDIIVVNSNVIHHTSTSDMLKYACLIIDTQFCKSIGIDPVTLRFCPKITSTSLLNNFKALIAAYENIEDICRIARLNEIIIKILIELRERYTVSEKVYTPPKRSFDAVKHTIKFIRTNYHRKISLDEAAQNVLMDKYSLSREFKKLTGQTIVQYINSFRCKKSAALISSGISVSESARMCGFTNMSFFTKTFKRYINVMPSEYKQKNLQQYPRSIPKTEHLEMPLVDF